jgi:hypothetical protein
MPTYTVRDPRSGKTVKLTGDSPPTEQELEGIFAKMAPAEPERSWTDAAVDALPAVGGTLGGIVGGIGGTVAGFGVGGVPGAVGGAAIGGAGGEALRQLAERARGNAAPATAMDAATGIAKEGAIQGGLELAGAGIARGASAVGRGLVENAVRPTMSLVREFPDVINTIVKERLPVGGFLPGVAKGSERAIAKLGVASQSVKALLEKAAQEGTEFSSGRIAQPVIGLIDDIAKQPLGEAQQKQLGDMITEFLNRHPGPLTPPAVKELKSRAQAIAKPVYRAVEKGFPVTAEQSLNARFNAAIASGAKETLETIPGVAAGEAHKKGLIGATRALKQAENRRLSLAGELGSAALGGTVGTAVTSLIGDSNADAGLKSGVSGWLIARGIASPRTLSRMGLSLTSKQAQLLLREFPRLADYMVREKERPAPQ